MVLSQEKFLIHQRPTPGTEYGGRYTVTLIPGDGIGHEMANSVKTIFKAAHVPVEWEQFDVSGYSQADPLLLQQTVDSIKRNKVALKGICATFFFILQVCYTLPSIVFPGLLLM